MLSTTHKFLYIHIPKTGGNSIQTVLAKYCDDEVVYRRSKGNIKVDDGTHGVDVFNKKLGFTKPSDKHASLADYHKKLGSELNSLFIFASVRNPFDRAISSTLFLRGPVTGTLKPNELKLLNPQIDGLKINGKIGVSHFIRFENLQEDFDKICSALNIPKTVLPHKNASIREDYSFYYTDETREFVRNFYREDLQYFGYEF